MRMKAKIKTQQPPSVKLTPPPSTNFFPSKSGLDPKYDSLCQKVDICPSEDKDFDDTNIPAIPPCTPSLVPSSDSKDNLVIKVRTDLYKDLPNDIEILPSKKLVELFLEELSESISVNRLKDYFSIFGVVNNVDLIKYDNEDNSGLAIVKIQINEKNKKKLSETSHYISRSQTNSKIKHLSFKVLFQEDTVADVHSRLDKRIGDNCSKLRLRGISRDITAKDIKQFFKRKDIKLNEVIIEGENGYVDFLKFENAIKWNVRDIYVKGTYIKVYRSWKDSSRIRRVSSIRSRSRSREGKGRDKR